MASFHEKEFFAHKLFFCGALLLLLQTHLWLHSLSADFKCGTAAAALGGYRDIGRNQRGEITSFLSHWSHSQFSLERRHCSFQFINPLSSKRAGEGRRREKRVEMKTTTTRKKKIKWSTWPDNQRRPHQWQLILSTFTNAFKQAGEHELERARAEGEEIEKRFFCESRAAAADERINIQ